MGRSQSGEKWRSGSQKTNKMHYEKLQMFGRIEKNTEFLSKIAPRQHRVLISTPLRRISVNLFKDKELLCLDKKAYCAVSGVWTVPIDLSASVGKMKNLSFFHERFMADKKNKVQSGVNILHMK